jgi:hypothetical protein
MKYAVLTNEAVEWVIRPIVRPTKVYIVDAETPKKAINAVKKQFQGKPINVIDAVPAEELPLTVMVKVTPSNTNPDEAKTVKVIVEKPQ